MTEDWASNHNEPTYESRDIAVSANTWNGSELPSTAVIEAVADETGRDPLDMQPLHHFIETDALDTLLSTAEARGHVDMEISFDYAGVSVTVSSGGHISID
ncbi:MAG: HalOD1 output domain-containing protein [Halobacteriota archaeon]